jgi:hypothetical protein
MAKAKSKNNDNDRIAERLVQLIKDELTKSIDSIVLNASAKNTARFTIACRLTDLDGATGVHAKIDWVKRFQAKAEAILDDPNQENLPLESSE